MRPNPKEMICDDCRSLKDTYLYLLDSWFSHERDGRLPMIERRGWTTLARGFLSLRMVEAEEVYSGKDRDLLYW